MPTTTFSNALLTFGTNNNGDGKRGERNNNVYITFLRNLIIQQFWIIKISNIQHSASTTAVVKYNGGIIVTSTFSLSVPNNIIITITDTVLATKSTTDYL